MRTLHIGVFTDDPDPERLFGRWISDGDSFLEWGERVDLDTTPSPVHLMYDLITEPTPSEVAALRQGLTEHLTDSERLTDYAVTTDAETWSEEQRVYLFDGSIKD